MRLRLKVCGHHPVQFANDPGLVIDVADLTLPGCLILRPSETLSQEEINDLAKRVQRAIGPDIRAIVVNRGIEVLEVEPAEETPEERRRWM